MNGPQFFLWPEFMLMIVHRWYFHTLLLLLMMSASGSLAAESRVADPLADGLGPFLEAFSGGRSQYTLSGRVSLPVDGRKQSVEIRLVQFDGNAFDLALTHSDYAVSIRRRSESTALALPLHGTVYLGTGPVDSSDSLKPRGIADRLFTPASQVGVFAPLCLQADAAAVSLALTGLAGVRRDAESNSWSAGSVRFSFEADGKLHIQADDAEIDLSISPGTGQPESAADWPSMEVVSIDRSELERQLVRGVRRAFEILAPSPVLTSAPHTGRKVPHGELRWIDGQRVALLEGTPEEVGRAHGELLKGEAERCIDSVLHTFGTVQTIRTGRWFRRDLEAAYARLSPHIPDRHKRETRAMAKALDLEPDIVESLNVFPELFHCSGFAVFGKATADGRLYHGRVLDYMTTIGLQDAATTFIVKVDGQIPFANVGYAGFIGSVSGMNAEAISLGEMGGRGEGQWDGAPMATLMRRALEECSTLDEVMDLWKNSPRTCEYYYVFADGKSNRAVGVAAVPESIEFIHPGQSHPRLGEGIEDAVVLSAGSRLEKLRQRVVEKYGQIDAATGQWLMSRPVAMSSNLHNVLFVPADGVLYVANADHRSPAAERPYARLDLRALLAELERLEQPSGTAAAAAAGSVQAADQRP